MKICIVGFGNIGSALAANLSLKGHDISVYSSSNLGREIDYVLTEMGTKNNKRTKISIITNNLKKAVQECELVFVTYPSFMLNKLADELTELLERPTNICVVPGTGGAEYLMNELVKNGHYLYGLDRVPYIARVSEKNENTIFSKKKSVNVASVAPQKVNGFAEILETLLEMKVNPIANYLTISLTPSNSILHTSRLYSLFKDYSRGEYYAEIPKFYEDWNDDSSHWLIELDKEVENIVEKLPEEIDISRFKNIREHYESFNISEMTKKISSISSFKSILTPMKKNNEGYVPDFTSRYFTEDFPFGLLILKAFSIILNAETPCMDKVIYWAQKYLNKKYIDTSGKMDIDFFSAGVPQAFGIESVSDVINYYGRYKD